MSRSFLLAASFIVFSCNPPRGGDEAARSSGAFTVQVPFSSLSSGPLSSSWDAPVCP